jgi:hypothetical protein
LIEILFQQGYNLNRASGFEIESEREDAQHGISNIDMNKRTPSRFVDLKNLLRQFNGETGHPGRGIQVLYNKLEW